jgi:hypothetical protein
MPINHPNFNINEQSYVNAYSLVLSNIQGPSNFENIDFKNFVFDIKIDINYQVLNDIQHELEQPYNDWTTIYEKEMNDTKKQMNLTYANHLLLNNENGQFYISENYLIKNSQCYSHSTPTTKIVYTFNDKDENQDIYFPEIIFDQTLEIIGTE